ncbi:retrovirus-related Pol polyprotein from transposon 297 [Trichonephila clavata]|uniref:Retrovirus-related Pol polyprotein from transposon 297 n=1 Tax=Trichonephila clavata TaxID=2740835 RepID=A0A8X6M6M4_TRICU|nr:retrovirus-related Pol polyprotein from transposon 297 [Trichonephila clavata]
MGAALVQVQNGKERLIAYASRCQIAAEKNYSTTEEECLTAILAIGKFRSYFFVRPFTVLKEHHSLCWLVNVIDPLVRLAC